MIAEVIREVKETVNEVFNRANEASPDGFVAYIAGGDYYEVFENTKLLPYVLEDVSEFRKDLSRQNFYVDYLNLKYRRDGFNYDGEKGVDFLTVELMIYSHLWQSNYFLKHLVRLSHLACGKEYHWKLDVLDNIRNVINDEVIEPLLKNNIKIGRLIKQNYYPVFRDSFAHSLYGIDEQARKINLYSKRATGPVTFEEFQKKFLYSVFLSHFLFDSYRENQKLMASFLMENDRIISLPDGHRIKVESEIKNINNEECYVFRPVIQSV